MNAHPVLVIAEAGVNHNGDRKLAHALVDAAADAGADAVKFQTFDAARLASRDAPKAGYQKRVTGTSESQFEMLRKLELPRDWHAPLQAQARDRGIGFLSTAFDVDSLDFLLGLGMEWVKVPSGELTNAPLLWRYARSRRKMLVSTGMATLSEVEQALAVIGHAYTVDAEPRSIDEAWQAWSRRETRDALQGRVTLLHCTSQYPTPFDEVNLLAMDTLATAFGLPVGYSDHTEGSLIPVAAVARGARVIEKHLTLDRTLAGPDHTASMEPGDFARMVREIRALQSALGDGLKAPQPGEWEVRRVARQQVVAARAIEPGALLCREDLATARCGHGLPPQELWSLVGRRATRAFAAGEVIET
jgi:N-acetylneuraminate synthase